LGSSWRNYYNFRRSRRLADTFGTPNSDNYEYWFSAANFLAYTNNLKVVRAANITTTRNATANGANNVALIKNEDDWLDNYSTGNTAYGIAGARYAGALGNTLKFLLQMQTHIQVGHTQHNLLQHQTLQHMFQTKVVHLMKFTLLLLTKMVCLQAQEVQSLKSLVSYLKH
jgi:hypothetical protein